MSAAVGAVSATEDVPFDAHLDEELKNKGNNKVVREQDQFPYSDGANYDDAAEETEPEEEEESKLESDRELDLGPQFSLKEQLEKDKVTFFFFFFSNVSSLICTCFPTVL